MSSVSAVMVCCCSCVCVATRPLLKQIENLQAANSTQVENWERIEVSLTQRLGKCEKKERGKEKKKKKGKKR